MRFEALRERLLRGGIAPWRVKRYLAELRDHLEDLTAKEVAAGYEPNEAVLRAQALLGNEAELAEGWLNQPKLKSFTARAPWAVFGLLPPLAAILVFVAPTLALIAIAKTHGMMMGHPAPAPEWFRQLAAFVTLTSNLLLPMLLAALLAFIATRQRLSVLWPLVGTALIALMGIQLHVSFPAPSQLRGSITLTSLVLAGPRDLPRVLSHWPLLLTQSALILLPLGWLSFAKKLRITSSAI
jgi:hypothetical protein